jgi:uncharacterized protein YhfF
MDERPKVIDGMPVCEFGFPGALRDRLVAAVLRGEKIAGASLRLEYQPEGDDPFPEVGTRSVIVDSYHRPVGIVEITEVRVVRAAEVDQQFAVDEGEGFQSVADWRAAHERFWGANADREAAGAEPLTIDDDTLVVCERFRLVERF